MSTYVNSWEFPYKSTPRASDDFWYGSSQQPLGRFLPRRFLHRQPLETGQLERFSRDGQTSNDVEVWHRGLNTPILCDGGRRHAHNGDEEPQTADDFTTTKLLRGSSHLVGTGPISTNIEDYGEDGE
ncbi:hypothetical protein DPMN_051479 [Dreissena polymorpha]|uniref:Uncharacterized protein n=1 Tax=Dreissena polymorpha TaxID=45954 RepID=A0A9D4CK17_DREPO|nr:hypothetical protein DPMN_051479 [Dreissena polymorpha]